MDTYTTSIESIEIDLAFEFALCAPEDVKGEVGQEIARIVKCAEAGEKRIDSPYLNAVIVVD